MMKRVNFIVCLLLSVFVSFAVASSFNESMIPSEISEETLHLSCTEKTCSWVLTGIRFDLDDEGFPVVIVKQKQTNLSERSIPVSGNLWFVSNNPLTQNYGSLLYSAESHYHEFLGSPQSNNPKYTKVSQIWELKSGEWTYAL